MILSKRTVILAAGGVILVIIGILVVFMVVLDDDETTIPTSTPPVISSEPSEVIALHKFESVDFDATVDLYPDMTIHLTVYEKDGTFRWQTGVESEWVVFSGNRVLAMTDQWPGNTYSTEIPIFTGFTLYHVDGDPIIEVSDLGSIRQVEFTEEQMAVLSDEHFVVYTFDGSEVFDTAGATSLIHAEDFFITELFSDIDDDWTITVYTNTGDQLDTFKIKDYPEMSASVSDGTLLLSVNGEQKTYSR